MFILFPPILFCPAVEQVLNAVLLTERPEIAAAAPAGKSVFETDLSSIEQIAERLDKALAKSESDTVASAETDSLINV